MCWLCVCCDRHGGAGCRFLCLALTSMSLAETRRDRGPHQYLNSLTFLRGLPALHSHFYSSSPICPFSFLSLCPSFFFFHQATFILSIPFSGLYISDCVIYSLSFLLSQCVLEFVTECYLLCLTTWCKVLDSLYFGCPEWVFGSGEISMATSQRLNLSSKLYWIFVPIFHGNDNSFTAVSLYALICPEAAFVAAAKRPWQQSFSCISYSSQKRVTLCKEVLKSTGEQRKKKKHKSGQA